MAGREFNKELIRRYRDNKSTPEELEVFFHLMNEGKLEKELEEVMEEESEKEETASIVIPIYRRNWFRTAAAAVIIFVIAGVYLLSNRSNKGEDPIAKNGQPVVNDVAPGGNKAVLTLADNSVIVLNDAQNGTLSQQGTTKITKLHDGRLAYSTTGNMAEVLYNTVSTPRGGQYQLTLSDGTQVWLNAASSLKFPAAFTGKERKVEITGEAYFEVAKDATKPFKVNIAGKGEVEVLGTHFNINSYADESTINTTLLEGKIKVSTIGSQLAAQNSQLLAPGQQAQIHTNGQIAINSDPDMDEVMAWKKGEFNFTSQDIQTIMRQISRWYDLDITYEGSINKTTYTGVVSRNSNVSQVLKIMEEGGVKFDIKGKRLLVH